MNNDIFLEINEARKGNKKVALCTIIETKGSTPRKAGSKMLVYEAKSISGTVGGGNIELKIIEKAIEVIEKSSSGKFVFDLGNDLDMQCGGYVEVFIESLNQKNDLIIFGAGHVGKAVARFASQLGFEITFVDNRKNIISDVDIQNNKFINKEYFDAFEDIDFTDKSFIIVTTPNHEFDQEVTAICIKKPHAYLGMIGSKRKVATTKNNLIEKGFSEKEIEKVDMPIGIKFNAQTPDEIAISIVAKLIDVRNSL